MNGVVPPRQRRSFQLDRRCYKGGREAGVIRQRQYGLERRSHVRLADLNARFPGLLDLVAAWSPEAP
ncbi:hypothetical protein [Actinomadura xylanilytica]|uniref:hypothetical protein n=1 Tax=Actinomadura xylanilytica TaxID=887459 RepID=UPI00255A961E|nr:hypothetical protein [Actinomadura xylanilytica]MDL4776247.1 hypothetical protein [Actinomadura xylanilytica]